jgi:hypothetical protein
MTAIMEQIKELCDLNSLHYHIDSNRVLIDDDFWFYINNMDDINNFKTYIHIIKGRNEMVNTICDKLNTTIEKGCNFKLFEYHQNEMVCISDNSIFININNMTDTCYTKYEQFIEFKLKIVLKSPLEYYLIDEDNKKSYKLKSTIDLQNVLDQLCTFEKRKCSKDLCDGIVNMKKDFPNSYGLCNDKCEYMLSTAHGYRNKSSSFNKIYFCSKECMDYFTKYNRCHRCHEDSRGITKTYIEELGYTLCNGRGDWNPPCIAKYRLEQRFKKDYKDNGFYEIDTKLKNCLLGDCDELKKIITDNGNKITYSMLMDLMNLKANFEVREREENEPTDKLTFEEQCQSIKEELY